MAPDRCGSELIKTKQDFAEAFHVSRETLDKLCLYEEQLRRWQAVKNLVAQASLDDLWSRHFADSAQLLALAPQDAKIWIDLGSGAGFPGLVVAILMADMPNRKVHLVEANARKCAFLHEIRRLTRAPVEIHNHRITSLADSDTVVNADVVCARALAPLDKLLRYAVPFFRTQTVGLFPKGKETDKEIQTAKKSWHFEFRKNQSRIDYNGCVIEVRNLRSV